MKMIKFISLLVTLTFPNWTFSQEIQSKEQKEVYNTIVLIGKAWSVNALDTLEKYIDKEYIHTDIRGQVLNREAWFNYIKDRKEKNLKNPEIEFEDININIYNDFAFVTGTNIFTGAAYTDKDSNEKRKLRFTQVLKQENKIWKRLLFQATYITWTKE
ncbi:MAG: nuclear transport factor 2 family protein [Cyclobacteriaceae bacterium]